MKECTVKNVLRSMTWSDPAEKDAAAKNIQRIDANRLLAITEEQKKIHASRISASSTTRRPSLSR